MSERRLVGLGAASIVLATIYVYWPQLGFYFTDVDTFALIATSKFETFDEFTSVLSSPMMDGQLTNALFYRPFSSMTWASDHMIWGANPLGYHLTDLLIHTGTSLVLFSLMLGIARWHEPSLQRAGGRITQGRAEALVASLLFAIHPVAMETVPAIARRPDLLFGLFQLLTLLSVYRCLLEPRWWNLVAAALFCVLGVASKDSAVVIPGIAVIFVLCFSAGETRRARILDCVRVFGPLLLATGLFAAIRMWVLGGIGGYARMLPIPLESVFKTSVGTFLCVAAIPGNLDLCTSRTLPWLALGLFVVVAASVVRLLPVRREAPARRVAFGVLAVGVFFSLYIAVRTPALTRTVYALIPFVCIFLAWGIVDGAVLLARFWRRRQDSGSGGDEGTPGFGVAVSAMRFASGAIFALVAASVVYGGWARVYVEEWGNLGVVTERTLASAAPHVEELVEGSVVYLINFPHKINNPRPPLRDHPIFQDHSVQGWADLVYPEKKLDVIGLSYITVHMREPEEVLYRVSFDRDLARVDIALGTGGSAVPFPTNRPYGKRHPLREISRYENESGSRLVIELHRGALAVEDIAFLVYLGDRVVMRRMDSWSVSHEPVGSTRASDDPGRRGRTR
jgi:hypothetical protein